MRERRYLLHIGQMKEGSGRDILFREAFHRIDRERRQKVHLLKTESAQAAGIGAGLLIQKALGDHLAGYPGERDTACQTDDREETVPGGRTGSWMRSRTGDLTGSFTELSGDLGMTDRPVLECYSVEELLSVSDHKVTEPRYRYGEKGKPYLADYPFQFNLSHSGDYVFCGVSEREIGVDIQKIRGDHVMRLAKRFFSDTERLALENCEDEELRRRMFFRMWVRKEAYGKLTGEGIPAAVGKCLWGDGPAEEAPWACAVGKAPAASVLGKELSAGAVGTGLRRENNLIWEEYDVPGGYRMAVCRFCKNSIVKRSGL